MTAQQVDKAADTIRQLVVAMVEKAKSGHPGGAMGGADFISVLYTEFLNFDPEDMAWPNRDRFFLDPGHMSPMLYSTLTLFSLFSIDEIKMFRQWGSPAAGHPEREVHRGIENTSGPLGQGHAMALGAAIAERFLSARFGEWMAHKIYAYISDGGVQEEISQGVGRLAGHLGLSNLIMFYDFNDIQHSTKTCDVTIEDTATKYRAWGWSVVTIDGNDKNQIRKALADAQHEKDRPTLIIGRAVMGKGTRDAKGNSYEGMVSTHGMPLSECGASAEKTFENLGADPAHPFAVDPALMEFFAQVKKDKHLAAKKKKDEQVLWEKANPEKARLLADYLSGKLPEIDWAAIQQKPNVATRAASSVVLAEFAKKVGNMLVSSADLANSDRTDGFLKLTSILRKGNFSGAFLQSGVAELTMATVMNGVAAHGGVIPVCETFFTFSDDMKPVIRLAAQMQLPVKYVFTQDTFCVGEYDPTYQPIDLETRLHQLEKPADSDGKQSLLILQPTNGEEVISMWKTALEANVPCIIHLTHQNLSDGFNDGTLPEDANPVLGTSYNEKSPNFKENISCDYTDVNLSPFFQNAPTMKEVESGSIHSTKTLEASDLMKSLEESIFKIKFLLSQLACSDEYVTTSRHMYKYDIFISYAFEDEPLAEELMTRLEKRNQRCFLAGKKIATGKQWQDEILRAINDSARVLFILTPRSYNREWIILETGMALALNKEVIPALNYVTIEQMIEPIRKFNGRYIETERQRHMLVAELSCKKKYETH